MRDRTPLMMTRLGLICQSRLTGSSLACAVSLRSLTLPARPLIFGLSLFGARWVFPDQRFRLAKENLAAQPIVPIVAELLTAFHLGHVCVDPRASVFERRACFVGFAARLFRHGEDDQHGGDACRMLGVG